MSAGNPQMIGDYYLGDVIGKGGYSTVLLGQHTSGQHVALKLLNHDGLASSASNLKQVQREIAAMSKLDHPNVLKMVEVNWEAIYSHPNGKQEKVIMVVLELAPGGELFDFLSYTGCFDETIARSYFHQLVAGLHFCHTNGIVHRDLKPENILLNADFLLKLADFGFAAASDQALSTECGTRSYMAPEMFSRRPYLGTATDVFSCGVVLFIILAGFPPFQHAMANDWWFHKLTSNQHALFWEAHCRTAYFSPAAKDLLNKMLEPNPELRITLDGIAEHEWFKGNVLEAAPLAAEMARRKEFIDAQKRREKLNSRAKHAGAVADQVHRAIDDVGQVIPPPPVLQRSKLGVNHFMTAVPATEALCALEHVLRQHDSGMTVVRNINNHNLEASFVSSSGPIELRVQVWQDDQDDQDATAFVVEVKKLQGDTFLFRRLLALLEAELTEARAEVAAQVGVGKLELSLTDAEREEARRLREGGVDGASSASAQLGGSEDDFYA